MQKKSLTATLKSYVYTGILPLTKAPSCVSHAYPKDKEQQSILTVCDPMTWHNISSTHAATTVTPRNWLRAFDNGQKYKFFFCEAAWTGINGQPWRAQVYKDGRVFYENRRNLLRLLDKCKANKLPTVFWAKEDPAYFENEIYDFTDTAVKFDYILTTAEECVEKYRALGHKQVFLWRFGFSPTIYYPPEQSTQKREKVAVFAGSWYTDIPCRCEDLTKLFDMLLGAGIPLKIYDRYRVNKRSAKPFPNKYQAFVNDGIPYDALGDVFRNVEFIINVNTVCDSSTMFARRVYEAMACGAIVVSNPSRGMNKEFGSNVWFTGKDFDFSSMDRIRQRNIETVFAHHTWEQRMKQLFKMIGVDQ